jgi:hypothetical protein
MKISNKYIILILLVFITESAFSQRNRRNEYNFKETNELSPVKEKYKNKDAVIIKNVKVFEYKGFVEYTLHKTVYKLIRINTDIGLKDYNKVAIPMNGVISILDFQVRFISPTGKVTTLQKSDLHKIKNLEGYGNFNVFAIKGAEVGGEIEIKYSVNMYPSSSHIETYYNDYPIQEARFELVAPYDFEIFVQTFNDFPELQIDTEGRKAWYADLRDIEAYEEEIFATNAANRMKVAYGVMDSGAETKSAFHIWNEKTQNIYEIIFRFSKREQKEADKLYSYFHLNDAPTEKKIASIKRFVLDRVQINPMLLGGLKAQLIAKEVRSNSDKFAFMAILFKSAGIEYEFVQTSDKYDNRFFKGYPFYFDMDISLFYFPETDLLLYPMSEYYPLGVIPYSYTENEGVFINHLKKKRFDTVPALDIQRSYETQNIDISIDQSLVAHINRKMEISTYLAAVYRSIFSDLNLKEMRNEMKTIALANLMSGKLLDYKIENDTLNWNEFPPTPLLLNLKLQSDMLVNKAGDELLINIGRVLSPAINLYHEEERKQDLVLDYPIKKDFFISLVIPTGYELANPDILNENIEYTNENGDIAASLKTTYSIKGDTLSYHIEETDIQTQYKVEEYSQLRKVINARADLAYKTLVLSRIK